MRALVLLLALTSAAHAGNNELTLGTHSRSLHAPSANAVSEDEMVGGALGIARRLPLVVFPRLDIWATGAMTWGGLEGTLFQTMLTDVGMFGLSAGGRARYELHPHVHVGGRLDLGTSRTSLRLEHAGHVVKDAAWGATATTALTIDLLAVARRQFSFGLRFELGYVAATAPSLSPREDDDETKITLDEMQASIGGLDLGGRFFSFALLSQF